MTVIRFELILGVCLIREKLVNKLRQLGVFGILTTWRDKTNVLFGIKSDFGMQFFN